MKAIALKVVVNSVALWAAATLISGIELSSRVVSILVVAVIFGLVNAVVKPIAKLLALPITLLTLGLFTVVINAAMLMLTDYLSTALTVDGLMPSALGALVISVVSWALSSFLTDSRNRK